MPETSASAPLSIDQAGDRIAALSGNNADPADKADKSGKKPKKQPEKKAKPAPEPEPEEPDADDAEDDADADPDADDAADDDAATGDDDDPDQSDDDESAEEDPDAADPDADDHGDDEDQTFTVKIDGEDHEIPLSELVAGYQRQADYTRKTKDLAVQRKTLETEREAIKDLPRIQKEAKAAGETFTQNAAFALTALQQRFMPKPPAAELAGTNPALFLQQKEAYEGAVQFAKGLQAEIGKYHATVEAETKAAVEKTLKEGRAKLFETVPDLKNETNRMKLTAYAVEHGFTEDQIKTEPSPVLFQWAWKAMKFDEIMKRRAALQPDKKTPKVVRRSTPADGHKAIADRKKNDAVNNHRQRKTIDSAAAAIMALDTKPKRK